MAKNDDDAEDRPNDEIAIKVAAKLLEMSEQRVTQLIQQGYIERHRRGFTTISSAVRGYIRFLKEQNERNSKSSSLIRSQEARAREVELRTAERARRLIPTEDSLTLASEIAQMARAEFAGFPARITRDLDMRRQMEAAIDDIFERLARTARERSEALRSGSLDLAPIEEE